MAEPVFSSEDLAVMRADARGLPAERRSPVTTDIDEAVDRALDGDGETAAKAAAPATVAGPDGAGAGGEQGKRIAALLDAVRSTPGAEESGGEVVPFHDDGAAAVDEPGPEAEAAGLEELDIEDAEEVTQPAEVARDLLHPPLPSASPDWFASIFDEDYLRVQPPADREQLGRELRFLIDGLAVPPGAKLLDLGCGSGSHTIELQGRGFDMVGLDSSMALLTRATDDARRRGLGPSFVLGDMRALALEGEFDGVLCVHGTIGYFEDDQNALVIANIQRALKPGSRLVMSVPNRDYFVGDLPARVCWEAEACMVLEEVDFDFLKSRLEVRRSIAFEEGRQVEHRYSVRVYGLHELTGLLEQTGFRVLSVSGHVSTPNTFLGPYSRSIWLVAQKC